MRYKVDEIDVSLFGVEGEISNFDLYYDIEIDSNKSGITQIKRTNIRITGIIHPDDADAWLFDSQDEDYTIEIEESPNAIDRIIPFMIHFHYGEKKIEIE